MSSGTVLAYKDEKRASLQQQIEALLAVDRSLLLQAGLQNLSFQAASDDVDRLFRLLTRLRACDLDLLTENRFQDCSRFVSEVSSVFTDMQRFSPSSASSAPSSQRDQIVQRCKRAFDTSNDALLTVLAISRPTLEETDSKVRDFVQMVKGSSDAVLQGIKSETGKARDEIQTTLESVRAATGAIGIEKQAEVFKLAAREHADGRRVWLWTTVTLATVTVLGLVANWALAYRFGPPVSSASLVQLTVAKVLVFSFLLSAVVWSGKVYRSHQHNYVINKHRQNALETFQLFARATEDASTKDMVLLQATKCIFAPQPTGFLAGERDAETASPQILEIIRSLASPNK